MMLKALLITSASAILFAKLALHIYRRLTKIILKDKVVVITGASGGVGEACAKAFHLAGCKVVLCGRRIDELRRVKRELISTMGSVNRNEPLVMPVDIAKTDEITTVVDNIINTCSGIDVLINNAGLSARGSVLSTNIDVYRKIYEINFFGLIAFTKSVLRHMVSQKCGSIVSISSIQGCVSLPYRSAYGSSKHALQSFSDSLRAEVSDHNIHIGVVSPSYIKTDISRNAILGDGRVNNRMDVQIATGMSPDYVAGNIVDCVRYRYDEITLGPLHHVLVPYLRCLVPQIFFQIMNHRARSTREFE